MNIIIIGNGKMGKLIHAIAKKRGHHILAIASSNNPVREIKIDDADVAIDFSTPNSAFENISYMLRNNIPVICGTTGWIHKLDDIKTICANNNGAFLYSPNFSLGMNLFFKLNNNLASLMKDQDYKITIHETHHKEKLDKPSGTAKKLAEDTNIILGSKPKVTADRINNIAGEHIIRYKSEEDIIEIRHTAINRNGFAIGAIKAAEWIVNKKGFFTINDLLK